MQEVVDIMNQLCKFFPGEHDPIIYPGDPEDDEDDVYIPNESTLDTNPRDRSTSFNSTFYSRGHSTVTSNSTINSSTPVHTGSNISRASAGYHRNDYGSYNTGRSTYSRGSSYDRYQPRSDFIGSSIYPKSTRPFNIGYGSPEFGYRNTALRRNRAKSPPPVSSISHNTVRSSPSDLRTPISVAIDPSMTWKTIDTGEPLSIEDDKSPNNQGTERLVVTRRNNGPIDSNLPCATATSGALASSKLNTTSSSFNTSHLANADAAGNASKTVSTTTTTTETALDYRSLNSILEDNLRPLTPVPGNPRSEQIHNEHKRLVQEYWEIQTQIVTNQAHRDHLQANMPAEELKLKKEYLKKLEEKEALLKFKANLQKQLDERKRAACGSQLRTPPAPHLQQNQHQQSAPPPLLPSAGHPSSLQRQDSATEAGWVIVSSDEGAAGGNPS